MKTFNQLILVLILLSGCGQNSVNHTKPSSVKVAYDTAGLTNNFYDNTETYPLKEPEITIDGEIANPGKADLSSLPVHSVFVKETLLDSTGADKFVGAYRYDGYSLCDILDRTIIKKANAGEFNPVIDLYIEIRNDRGDKVVFSWGEIYYPNNLHRILIARSVSRIVPSRTKDLWPIPAGPKIVAGTDLITERNIPDPVRITVRSFPRSITVKRGMSPMFSKEFSLFDGDKQLGIIAPDMGKETISYNTVFYGRGRGIHSTSPFTGILLKDVIQIYYPANRQNLKTGLIGLVGLDGYRCALSYSEIFNRNDQQEFLLIRTKQDEDGGLFRVFAASDFFSDRAVKSLTGIYLLN
ncbi:MAG: hypothetical protein ABR974_14525 [Bacteroidales bacterium]|jgi:hypothetical protein